MPRVGHRPAAVGRRPRVRVWVMRFRLPLRALAAYAALVLLALGVVTALPSRQPSLPEGVPAWAPVQEPGAPAGTDLRSAPSVTPRRPPGPPLLVELAQRLWAWCRQRLLDVGLLKGALRLGLPALAGVEPPRPPVVDEVQPPARRVLDGLLRLVGGAEAGRPWTLLAAELPGLQHLEVPEPGPMFVPASVSPGPDPAALRQWQPQGAGDEPEREPAPAAEAMRPPSDLPYVMTSDRPVVLVYHTHASEAYLGPAPAAVAARADALAFSDDPRRSIVQVGATLAERLRQHGLGVIHLRAVFDRSDGAVNRFFSYAWARRALLDFGGRGPLLTVFPSLRMVVDVHRDHLPGQVAEARAKTTATIRGQSVARIMLVVGDDHPQARVSYCFARAVADLTEAMYPGLSRGVKLAPGRRYNQDLVPGALLVEVGGTFNTLEEAERAAALLADVLAEAMRRGLVPEPGRPYRCPGGSG